MSAVPLLRALRRAAAAVGAVVLLGWPSAAADAAFAPCGRGPAITCETVAVPVDRAGREMGSIPLHVEREPAVAKPARGAVLALAGGPGESATARLPVFEAVLRPARRTRDLIVFDQRGTGRSGYLTCHAPLANGCAQELEPGIHHYTTLESADDVEAVRRTLGVERIALFGVSYGTKVALAYAKRYPTHVELLVLDSVVPVDGFDFFERESYHAVPRVLADVCRGGSCSAFTANLQEDVAAAVRRAEAGRLRVRTVGASGAPTGPTKRSGHDLFSLLAGATSYDPVVRARFPSALRSALDGDGFPLGRLLAAVRPNEPRQGGGVGFNDIVFRGTLCEDLSPTRWRNSTLGTRTSWATDFLGALPPGTFSPFTATTALGGDLVLGCRNWPVLPTPPTISGPGPPDVPVLLLNGDDDLLTPTEGAEATRTAFPHGIVVDVPDMGHAVEANAARSSGGGCARRALERFFASRPVARCARTKPRIPPLTVAPTSVEAFPPMFAPAAPGRLLRVALATLADVRDTSRSSLLPRRGLRGGLFYVARDALQLSSVEYVDGVRVSGTYRPGKLSGPLRITGSFGTGTFTIGRDRRVRGTIEGHRFTVAAPAGL